MSSLSVDSKLAQPIASVAPETKVRAIVQVPVPIDVTGQLTEENLKHQFLFSCEERYSAIATTEALYKVINSTLPIFGISQFKVSKDDFHECVKNSYDAFVDSSNFKRGDYLVLELVIKRGENFVKVKLKDNGTGFLTKQKGERFKPTDEFLPFSEYAKKKKDKTHFGGIKDGVYFMVKSADQNRIEVDFKNRKKGGAAVSWTFAG